MGYKILGQEKGKKKPDNNQKYPDNVIPVTDNSDISQTIKELNKDEVDSKNKFSDIDLKSNLHPIEVSAVLCFDTLVSLGFLPDDSAAFLTRKKLRLAVSQGRGGRDDIVHIAQGLSQQKNGTTWGQSFMSLFKGGNQ